MTSHRKITTLLRTTSLSLVLIAGGAATALADPPGYYFQDLAARAPSQPETTRMTTAPSNSAFSDAQTANLGEHDRPASLTAQCEPSTAAR